MRLSLIALILFAQLSFSQDEFDNYTWFDFNTDTLPDGWSVTIDGDQSGIMDSLLYVNDGGVSISRTALWPWQETHFEVEFDVSHAGDPGTGFAFFTFNFFDYGSFSFEYHFNGEAGISYLEYLFDSSQEQDSLELSLPYSDCRFSLTAGESYCSATLYSPEHQASQSISFQSEALDLWVTDGADYDLEFSFGASALEAYELRIDDFQLGFTHASIEHGERPFELVLGQPYPNPFNAAVHVPVVSPFSAEIRVEVLDLLGRKVAHLPLQPSGSGVVTWRPSGISSGTYILQVVGRQKVEHKTICYVK